MLIIEDRWGGIRATGCVSKWSIPRLCSIFKWEINYYILTIGFLGVLPILIDKATDLAMDHFGYPRNAITSCQKMNNNLWFSPYPYHFANLIVNRSTWRHPEFPSLEGCRVTYTAGFSDGPGNPWQHQATSRNRGQLSQKTRP